MWSPTHITVTVYRARNLIQKGRDGNDAYTIIKMGKNKFQTTAKEKTLSPVWNEECEFQVSEKHRDIDVTIFHRNLLGLDEFLGRLSLPLDDINQYHGLQRKWYPLRGKSDSKKIKERGEIEVSLAFSVRSKGGSLLDLSGGQRNVLTDMKHAVGDKLKAKKKKRPPPGKPLAENAGDLYASMGSLQAPLRISRVDSYSSLQQFRPEKSVEVTRARAMAPLSDARHLDDENDEDPSLRDDDKLPPLSPDTQNVVQQVLLETQLHEPSTAEPSPFVRGGSLRGSIRRKIRPEANLNADIPLVTTPPALHVRAPSPPPRLRHQSTDDIPTPELEESGDEDAQRVAHLMRNAHAGSQLVFVNLDELEETSVDEPRPTEQWPHDVAEQLGASNREQLAVKSRDELLHIIQCQRETIQNKKNYIRDLESYLDNLLLKVMETQPKLLQKGSL